MIRITLAAALLAAPAVAQAPPKPACAAAEHRQFDFWVGRWQVSQTGKDGVVAESLIEKVYNGCGIRENWMPKNKQDGGSLNIYLPGEKAWKQTWIDSGGTRADFTGGWTGKAMVLTGKWDGPLVRMTYTPNPDGSVRQAGEQSTDGGKTWTPSFDFTYRRGD
ncbi:hypothetical protein [uncultured Phenylobacterium sp.]|uniref:hypothetical protein n=1 Tax=uncultured Phenylobacterium sp. TaxID=349273 RepID=UPI00260151A3|nr:hypothetical protein [uncultured Phenylobacterium sp.]